MKTDPETLVERLRTVKLLSQRNQLALQNEAADLIEQLSRSSPIPTGTLCADCGQPEPEHSYNGACYGVCGKFRPSPVAAQGDVERACTSFLDAIDPIVRAQFGGAEGLTWREHREKYPDKWEVSLPTLETSIRAALAALPSQAVVVERCAKIVEDYARLWSDEDVLTDLSRIAAAIRALGKEIGS